LAKHFERYILSDPRFEIIGEVSLGLVCFRLKDQSNQVNEELLKKIKEAGKIYMVPSQIDDTYFLRLAIVAQSCDIKHIDAAWDEIKRCADILVNSN
jgi:glutamate/tyrosine decarboxylase-like PLP-dependent enzyme